MRQTDAYPAASATPVKQDKPKGSESASDASGGKPQSPYPEVPVQAVDFILAQVYGLQSTSQANAARKRKVLRRWVTPQLSVGEYREKHGGPDGKGGCYVCYGRNRDHRHDDTCCEVRNRQKAQYFQRHPDEVPQHDQGGGHDPRQHRQTNGNGECYTQLMMEIQELRNQLATSQLQGSPGPKA